MSSSGKGGFWQAQAGGVSEEMLMATLDINAAPLSPSEHQVQLRRAVIASTIGTAIEWYDFFLYSIVTGLVFAKLFFPHSDVPRRARLQSDVRRAFPCLGLAYPVRAEPGAGRRRPLHPARHSGDTGVHQAGRRAKARARPDAGRDQTISEANPALRAGTHGRASAVLHLHRLHLFLRHRCAARLPQLPVDRGAGGFGV